MAPVDTIIATQILVLQICPRMTAEGWMPIQYLMMLPDPNHPTGWETDETLPEGWKLMSNLRVVSEGNWRLTSIDIDGQGLMPSTSRLT